MLDSPLSVRFVIERDHEPDALVLRLIGELDVASAPLLEGELEDAESTDRQHLMIDLSRLEFIDSTGLKALLRAQKSSLENGHQLSLRHALPAVRRVFEVTKTD